VLSQPKRYSSSCRTDVSDTIVFLAWTVDEPQESYHRKEVTLHVD
jgi:hypothetical protein